MCSIILCPSRMYCVVLPWPWKSRFISKVLSSISHNVYCTKSSSPSAKVLAKPVNSVVIPISEPIKTNNFIPEISSVVSKKKAVNQDQQWTPIYVDRSKLIKHYLMLSKIRLTSLVVITSMAGYAMAPAPFDLTSLALTATGTGLLSCGANSVNQFFEVPFDSQMSRTKNRVLVRKYLTPLHAVIFASSCVASGFSVLYFGVNGLTAALGVSNFVLYTLIYTPLKRISILNTWIGSVVGAIPPLMGWAGCAGELGAGAWIMAAVLYAWQFPHFNALSWNLRPDYSRAGYRMMAVTNPGLCRRTALRYTVVLLGLSFIAPALDVTHWWFAVASAPLNAYFCFLAWRFYSESDSANSRKLFRFSLIHLPVLMGMLLVSKKYWSWNQESVTCNVESTDDVVSSNSVLFPSIEHDSCNEIEKVKYGSTNSESFSGIIFPDSGTISNMLVSTS